jgi:hypothetical protein
MSWVSKPSFGSLFGPVDDFREDGFVVRSVHPGAVLLHGWVADVQTQQLKDFRLYLALSITLQSATAIYPVDSRDEMISPCGEGSAGVPSWSP